MKAMTIEKARETGSSHLGGFPALQKAERDSDEKKRELDTLLRGNMSEYDSEDTSLVVFGSLARREWTTGSDLDWTYLVDGQANSDHLVIAQKINAAIEAEFKEPGPTGIFGNMAFSHDIVHQIGGQSDTNRNTTQRVLLLLESRAVGKETAYDRIIKAVINRYLEEDNHLLTEDDGSYRVPRFLLNDIVRFWRTMAVDFASKQRDRGGKGWGLRNAKLRMSRKLIFASGLLICFSCHLDPELQKKISTNKKDKNAIKLSLVKHIHDYVRLTPLQVLARSLDAYSISSAIQTTLFASYADFLTLLNDEKARESLEELRAEDSRTDPTFIRVKEISRTFQESLDHIFFENESLKPLTRKYGVF
jgi:predicted nucleotidyltransferase